MVPNHVAEFPLLIRKARVLIIIHLFLIFISVLMHLFNTTFFPEANPQLKLGVLIGIGLLYVFKRWGSFMVSGNLLSLFVGLILGQAVFITGGLYSDNLLWLMAVPLLALLFSNPTSGFLWLVALLGFTSYLYLLEMQATTSFRQQTLHLDGSYFWVTYCGLFVMVVGIVLIFATGQALIIKTLQEKQEELTRQKAEITRQAQSLKEAEEKLISSNQQLEQFAYAASHDLKEPLRMINMYTQLTRKKLTAYLDQDTREYMAFVTDGVVRMERLLTDLLEYSRLGRNKQEGRDANLNDVLQIVISNLMAAMKETDAAILSNQLPVIKASATEMIRLFQNLISNSIKFRQKGVKPVVEITCQSQNGSYVFQFHDNGIGIPEEHRSKVFNLFERLHSIRDYEGTGIGLASCKKIVNHLGGEIWIEPGGKEGTTFCFSIPRQAGK